MDDVNKRAAYPGCGFESPIYGGYAMGQGTTDAIRFPEASSQDVLTGILEQFNFACSG